MAKSFYRFDADDTVESFNEGHFYHKPSNKHYEMKIEHGQMTMERYRMRDDGTKINLHRQTVDFVVGSGNQVRTYLYRNELGEMFQLPVVWYSQTKQWGMAPGYDRPDHDDFTRPITRHCMFCHNAYPEFEPGTDRFGMLNQFPAELPQGIGCQRCHGPGSEHIRLSREPNPDPKRVVDSIVNPASLDSQLQDDVCNQCHFQPTSERTSFVRKLNQPDYSYQPGHPLDDYIAYFELDVDTQRQDHFDINHHSYRLYQSQCYINSGGAIRCTTCHDPHAIVPPEDRVTHYRAACLTCHASDDCLDVEHGRQPEANCVGCHMVRRRTEDVVSVTMTDHKISRRSKLKDPTAPLSEYDLPSDMPIRPYAFDPKKPADPNTALYEKIARLRDNDHTAIESLQSEIEATKQASTEPQIQLAQSLLETGRYTEAIKSLLATPQSPETSSIINTNLGVGWIGAKQYSEAIKYFQKAIASNPVRPEALYNMGVAYARLRQNENAIKCFRNALKLRPTYTKCRFKLGNTLALIGQLDAAGDEFEQTLQIDPDDAEAYQKLGVVRRMQGNWRAAIQTLVDGRSAKPNDQPIARELCLAYLSANDQSLRDAEKAVQCARDSLRLAPADAESAILLGLALVASQQPQEAINEVQAATGDVKFAAEVALVLAMAYRQIGNHELANANFQNAMQILPGGPPSRLRKLALDMAKDAFDTGQNKQ